MTPALQEKTMKAHGIYLPPTLSSGAVESSETLVMGNAAPVKGKIKDHSVAKISSSVLGLPTAHTNHTSDNVNLEYFDSLPSKGYTSFASPSLAFSANRKNHKQMNVEDFNCSKINPLSNSNKAYVTQMINSKSGEQTRGHTSLGATGIPSRTGRLLSCKGYQTNGLLGGSSLNPENDKEGFSHQVPCDGIAAAKNCSPKSKEQELNFRLLQCISKQQILLSRAKRTQKRLQIMLAKHVVRHCDQQMKCFVRHQLRRMKAFHDHAAVVGSGYQQSFASKNEDCNREGKSKGVGHHCSIAPHGDVKVFAHSAAGLLSQVEKSLDSEATCSSSSEDDDDDDDEHISRNVVAINYTSDWKWLVDRATVGCRWTWLQAQISELEYKIQQLTDLHRQIHATKGTVILQEFPIPKDILKNQMQLTVQETLLTTTGSSQALLERQDAWPEHDFEISPSSPTLLLRNIEKQSAQLSEIISSLVAPLNLSPTSSPLSSKSCTQKELVNGISLQDLESSGEISSSSSWLVDQQHLKRRRKEKTKSKTSPVIVMSTSARTRPLLSFQKRRLYKMSPGFMSEQQAMQLRDAFFNTENESPASMWHSYELSRTSRRQKEFMLDLEPSFHPVLSFPSDIPLHVHFKTLVKKYEIKGDRLEASVVDSECARSPSTEYLQYKAPVQQWHFGYESSLRHQTVSKLSEQLMERRRKRHLSETVTGESNNRLEAYCFQSEDQEPQVHFVGAAIGGMTSKLQINSRRRLRSESSYDIDNIVIPMSLVAPSKLEKLQYKEILTPSWRTVNLEPLGSLQEEEEKAEDLSDETYAGRHAKCESKERARWSLWEQSQWPKKNRSNSRSSEAHGPSPKEKLLHCDLTTDYLEDIADVGPEICRPLHLGELPSSGKDHEARANSILWDRRSFPLKDADALTCQRQITGSQESPDVAVPSDCDCASYGSIAPMREEHGQVNRGMGGVRKET